MPKTVRTPSLLAQMAANPYAVLQQIRRLRFPIGMPAHEPNPAAWFRNRDAESFLGRLVNADLIAPRLERAARRLMLERRAVYGAAQPQAQNLLATRGKPIPADELDRIHQAYTAATTAIRLACGPGAVQLVLTACLDRDAGPDAPQPIQSADFPRLREALRALAAHYDGTTVRHAFEPDLEEP